MNTNIVGIDPSVTCTGFARLDAFGMFESCEVCPATTVDEALRYVGKTIRLHDNAWIEVPKIYRVGLQKGDQNDLISIALVAGGWAQAAVVKRFVHPHEWKGQLPKKIAETRVRAKLSVEEVARLDACMNRIPRGLRNNAYDAVGIALHGAGRSIR